MDLSQCGPSIFFYKVEKPEFWKWVDGYGGRLAVYNALTVQEY
jgi:hypothetical protein